MIVAVQGTKEFNQYNIFLRAMSVALSGMKDDDNEFIICDLLTFHCFDDNKKILKELALLITSIFLYDIVISFSIFPFFPLAISIFKPQG
jgi:hypothetical protein